MIWILACVAKDGDSFDTVPAGDTQDTAETGDSTETGETADTVETGETGDDTGTPQLSGLLKVLGQAVVADSFLGSENVLFLADDGEGETICEVNLTLTSEAARTDCELCVWAFDLVISDVTTDVTTECAAVGWEDAAALEGTTRSYGYDEDYYGHAPVMLEYDGSSWVALSYAYWSAEDGTLLYQQVEGYFPY